MKKFYKLSFLFLMLLGFTSMGVGQTTADAGGDKTICQSEYSYTLLDASADYDVVTWVATGSGSCEDNHEREA